MHADSERSMEFAKIYTTTIMKEFMDEYGFDIAHLRVVLDQNPDLPQSSETVEKYTQKFKQFAIFAEKIKSTPRYVFPSFPNPHESVVERGRMRVVM